MAFQTIDLGGPVTSGSLASGTFSIGGMTFTVSTGVTVTQESGRLKFSENIANGDFILTVVEDGGDGNFSFESAFLDSNSTGGDPGFGPQLSFVEGLSRCPRFGVR